MISENDFSAIVRDSKQVVLSAVRSHLPARYFYAIDDAVQETYIRAFRALEKGSFRGDAAVSSWLYTIARNESIRIAKKLDREEEKALKHADRQALESIPSDTPDIEDVAALIDGLPDEYRGVFSLLIQGKKERSISLELGIPVGTVKSRIFRGREIMRRLRMEACNE
jgi:RNA polymerase sigma-70 factor (ECF subfamily)